MDFAPKTTEELLVYAVLIAVAGLWRAHIKEKGRCEVRVEKLEKEITDMHLTLHRDSSAMADRGEERERLLALMVQKVTTVMDEQKDILINAVRMLRRYDPDPTPRPYHAHDLQIAPKHDRKNDDETSAIFRDATAKGGR